MLGDSDLPTFFRDFGQAVVAGAESTLGILDRAEELVVPGYAPGFTGQELALLLMTGALASLAVGLALTVDGTPYVVRERLLIGDGKLTLCKLELP